MHSCSSTVLLRTFHAYGMTSSNSQHNADSPHAAWTCYLNPWVETTFILVLIMIAVKGLAGEVAAVCANQWHHPAWSDRYMSHPVWQSLKRIECQERSEPAAAGSHWNVLRRMYSRLKTYGSCRVLDSFKGFLTVSVPCTLCSVGAENIICRREAIMQ